ncbi:regulatory LuxR family protein [Kribbella orskensis]|uniref:Regulatory LuxR family protein n=1 Tax=Kribbella orskensis TaxID=2512216 RepID=A0ABY2BT93_9ACTN|nr:MULTISPECIES: helix-turn-helix transcriptional regulator [Kribbella]TCN44742.1 regulatory LuxR family protein [Kribbella sp. VKM Ac-2500]TCO31480.1 regulatory LuxR family protein [Kribbella orskensis]
MGASRDHPRSVLHGRRSECEALAGLLDQVHAGRSSVLVLRGEAGCGKSALLDFIFERASGFRVARVVGVESEMELAFAGLHQLCAPMLDRVGELPVPQRDALRVAFGLQRGDAPDRFLVGLAVLSLLAGVAEGQPLACLIDDVQWLDRASVQTLAFVARRVEADPVALVFAVRESSDEPELTGLPELKVHGLGEGDARLVLASAIRGRLDYQVRDRIVAETRGNPLALLQLPRGLTPAELAGGFGLPATEPVESRIEQSFHRQFQSLPRDTQRLLLTAAAEPIGDATLLWRAAELQGIGAGAAAPAVAVGLVELGARVRFRHPLVRSAVYRPASLADRQAVHRVLAEATDPEADPDRRAWHRARATSGPDEAVADELERSADRARARGGAAAAAAFLERATELTPDPGRRGARALAAAQAMFDAGAPNATEALLATAELGPLDDLRRAGLERLRAEVAFSLRRGNDAPPLLLNAAQRLEALDPELARETYLEALGAEIFAGRLSSGRGVVEAAEAARTAPRAPQQPRAIDLLLDGLVSRFTEGYAAGVQPLEEGLRALRREEGHSQDHIRWLWLGCRIAVDLWDDESWHELATRQVRLARDAGALAVLPIALTYRAGVHVHAGEFSAAAQLIDEADAITEATAGVPLMYTSLVLSAWSGQEAQALALVRASVEDATGRGEGRAIALAEYATAVLYNGLGRYEDSLAAAQRACEQDDLGLFGWGLVELIEAAARSGNPEIGSGALRRLEERARAAGTDWALGMEARSRALLSDGDAADALYREAIERLTRSRIAVHLARAHLLYGEWLRRENRRLDARRQLGRAHDMFSRAGAEGFAERARRELLATGESVRKRMAETFEELTAQEAQIARLARDDLTNPEIGAHLFISPRTVEWHLGHVFAKLDITSRRQLRRALPDPSPPTSPA